jgi:hypothetical protein
MGGTSVWHWIIVLLYLVLIIWPVRRILIRAGINEWWAILSIIPLVNIAALWIFAQTRWPRLDQSPL